MKKSTLIYFACLILYLALALLAKNVLVKFGSALAVVLFATVVAVQLHTKRKEK